MSAAPLSEFRLLIINFLAAIAQYSVLRHCTAICPARQLPLLQPHLATQPGQPSHSDDELAPVCLGMADVCPQATKLATAPLLIYCDGLSNNPTASAILSSPAIDHSLIQEHPILTFACRPAVTLTDSRRSASRPKHRSHVSSGRGRSF